ncbi:MAG TPA: VOC family protein [Candidatus Nanopelagicales bacterium]|nr:VOC family protein [Candidatus Nanopelagicales bacterium]
MTTPASPPFHLAFPVNDIEATRRFYVDVLGCRLGREAERWIDFDFFGHQISAHLVDRPDLVAATNLVDGDDIPVRHFGAVLPWADWHALRDRLREVGVRFLVEPHIRFQGEPGEQATMFITDPSGNAIELKSFQDPARLFARA